MRKRISLALVLALFSTLLFVRAYAADSDEWSAAPVVTKVYESGKEQLIVEWEGSADLYYVYLDGKKTATVNLNYAILDVKAGRHQLQILPIRLQSKEGDKNFGFEVSLPLKALKLPFAEDEELKASANVDLSAFGIDPKDVLQGTRSPILTLNYNTSPFFSATPEVTSAATDFDDNVILTFTDKYDSESYQIGVKSGKDVTYVEFDRSAADAAKWITKDNSTVTVILDRDYLKKQGCMIPELDEKYSFTVKLGKYAVDLVSGEAEPTMLLGSKESKGYGYTPTAAWKTAPEITYASQSADGQVTLRWTHETNGLACEYEVIRINKVLGVKKGEEILGQTAKNEFVVNDLMNGTIDFAVVPVYKEEKGEASETAAVELSNSWVAAPSLTCEALSGNRVRLTWESAAGVESYHIVVYAGSGSVLRFVNLDYKKYGEFDVTAKPGKMEYIYEFGSEAATDNGVKLRFEIYGLRHAANGEEQRSAVSKQSLVIQ